MQQNEILNKRNLLMVITYFFSTLIFTTVIVSQLFNQPYYFLGISIGSCLILFALYYVKTPPKVLQIILICTWHMIVFLFNYQNVTILSFYTFIWLIAILTIYRSFIITFINIALVFIEIFILDKLSMIPYLSFKSDGYLLLLGFLIAVCIMSIGQSYFIKNIWLKLEKSAIDREYYLNSKHAYLHLFFEQANDAIAVFDLEDRVIAVNPAFEKLYGWTKDEAIGRKLPLVPPEHKEEAKKRINMLKQRQSFHLFESIDMKKDGTVFDAQISLSPILSPHGEIIASSVISRDISYIKENENLILQSEKLKLVGELAAGVAHEIRNPMTVISGYVQMMNENPNSPYYEYTKLIQSETERIELILSEFLVLSKPQPNQFIPINLVEALTEVANFFQYELQQKSITVNISNEYSHMTILGNKNQIKQVFINLFKNAIEAISDGGIITVEVCKDEKDIYISIVDTGCGISPQVLDRIFEPFYTTKTAGTGLGMVIINKIIQDHNGTIKINSQLNVGTEILLSFPVLMEN
ncbi:MULTISPECIES: two-component system sensor histidine kinase NtrB [Solibacillus]|uniref:histidine kinase n=1 Tax=Solibacillus merdavium TaxID=2762218 RepID=A0ABR8XHY7_9BACL|nr:PAS domain-containing sensor histidine kinase [Solibacillus merdavium]MBD8031556.1 PAS domain S-box protein [Solibacillus merdavium]